ncbi:MFS transporter [Nonomuraea sp. NPDC050691]|uniref:MFS transporter n=1 Tax=Nonomuraea sp. NPDC050691 TaxID=3155661 RepID=UPI003403650D
MTITEATRSGLLRRRDFRLLWIGESVSSLGSSVTGVALPMVAVTVLDAPPFAVGGLIADAASFAVSAVCLARIERREVRTPGPHRRLRAEIRDGMLLVARDPLLRGNTLYGCAANLALTGYTSLVVLFLVDDVGIGAGQTGLLIAATSLGGIVGALAARPMAARLGGARAVPLGKAGLAPTGLLIPLADRGAGLALVVLGGAVIVAGVVAGNVVFSGFIQTYVPGPLRRLRDLPSGRLDTRL